MSRLPNISLRLRLMLLVLLAVVPLLGLVLYNASQERARDLAAVSQRAQSAAALAANNVAQRLQGQRQLLVTLAELPAVSSGDAAGCTRAAASILAQFTSYTNIGAARANGDIFCSATPLTQTTNVAQRNWFQEAVSSGNFALGDYQFSARAGVPVVVGAYPVRQGAILQAVVYATLDLTQFNSLAQGAALPNNATTLIVDSNGTILAQNPDPGTWVGQTLPNHPLVKTALAQGSGAAQLAGLDGVMRLYGFAAVNDPVPGLHLAVGIPTEVAFADANLSLIESLLAVAVVTMVVLFAARQAAGAFVLAPVASLVSATRRFAAGDLATRSGGPYRAGEIDELALAFDNTAQAIQLREVELEQTNRLLKTLSECNQALVRSTEEAALLRAICQNVVRFGQYTLAWVDLAGPGASPDLRTATVAAAAPESPPPPRPDDGPAAAALRAGQPVVTDLAGTAPEAAFPQWRDHAGLAGYRVLIALPIQSEGQPLGVLSIATANSEGFSPSDMQLLVELSGDLAFGLSALRTRAARDQAEAQLAENGRRWRALAELDQKLGEAAPRYQALVDELAARTSELIGDATIVNLLSEDGLWLTQAALHHPNPEARTLLRALLPSEPQPVNEQGTNRVLATGEAILVPDVPQEPLRAAVPASYLPYLDRYGVHSLLIVAMRAQGKVIGTLMAARGVAGRPYSEAERDFLQSIADQAALAIANARLYDQLQAANAALEQRVAERTAALEREVTERRRAQAEIEDLYNSAPCGYHSLDASGVFMRVNDYEANLLGYTRAELIGHRTFMDVLTPASREVFEVEFSRFLETGRVHNLELDICRRDGSPVPVLMSATGVRDEAGGFLMTRSTMLDIADHKQAEARIQELNEALRQRATALEATNGELEAFSYSVSHDLRAPLRSIDGFSLALIEDFGPQLTGTALDYLQRVRAAAQRMAGLIDDLLNLSRVTRSELRIEPVDLSALASSQAAELKQADPGRQADFVIAPGLTAQGDGRLLGLMLNNLMSNAWKFTGRRKRARIEFGALGENDARTFFVRDNGAGFDMAYVQRLFGAFQRLHDQNEYPGTGIGLATVQRIIQRHGGQVWAEGQADQGATFYFTIGHRHERKNHPAG